MSHLYALSSVSDQEPLVIVLAQPCAHNVMTIDKWWLYSKILTVHLSLPVAKRLGVQRRLLRIISLLIMVILLPSRRRYLRDNLAAAAKPYIRQTHSRLPGNGLSGI